MARFDPNTYPDRLAFEAHVRRIRAEEIARVFSAAGAWLAHEEHVLVNRVARLATAVHHHSHGHSPH